MHFLLNSVSPGGEHSRLSILIFHRVLAAPDELLPEEFHSQRFDVLCGWLRRWFNVLPLEMALRRLEHRSLPPRSLAITFDDGYADNHDVALPILQKHGLAATVFVSSGFLDGGRMWNDTVIEAVRHTPHSLLDLRSIESVALGVHPVRNTCDKRLAITALVKAIKYLPPHTRNAVAESIRELSGVALRDNLMLCIDKVVALRRAGIQIGAHTVTHPILACLTSDEARDEIVRGKRELEEIIQEPVTLFAYPNGRPNRDYNAETVALVREAGFDAAVTTTWGAATSQADPFQIPRFTPWDRDSLRFRLRLAQNLWSSRYGVATVA
jgi:peptidoglycan/xylan/chitin deacetylase (PgdA/CDA1 family)